MRTYRGALWTLLGVLAVMVFVTLGAAGPAGATSGTMYVSSNTTLTEDHVGSIWITANSVTLDCAGHSVIGSAANFVGIGIDSKSKVAIKNCRSSGFGYGIYVGGYSTSVALIGNTTTNNTGPGIWVAPDVTRFQVRGNVSTDNASAGIWLMGSHGTVLSNVVSHNSNGIAVGGLGQATDIAFIANSMSDNAGDGFLTYLPSPQAHYDSDIRLGANVSDSNGDSGFELNGMTDGISLVGNHAIDNGAVGFIVGYSDGHTFDWNVATGNALSGFAINASSHDAIRNNVARNNSDGFFNDRLTDSSLTNNVSYGNANVGIWLGASARDVLRRNNSNHNGGAGYVLYGVDDSTYDGNTATNNKRVGFTVNLSSHVSLTHNVANNNAAGFIAYLSTNNTFSHDIANSNTGAGFVIYPGSTGNSLVRNVAHANGDYDALDGNPLNANTWLNNSFGTTSPPGLD